MTYKHDRTPWFSPLDGYHPMMSPLKDAIDHLAQAAESTAGFNPATLRSLLAQVEHHVAFLRAKLPDGRFVTVYGKEYGTLEEIPIDRAAR